MLHDPPSVSPFANVVFAGGGNRCLWQAGFYEIVAPEIGLRPTAISGSSAGATVACFLMAGRSSEALEQFKAATGANARNMYPLNALRRGRPVFPHEQMYRDAILSAIDAPAWARLQAGPDIRVQLTRLPRWLGPRLAATLGILAYSIEKRISNPVHPRAGAVVGFHGEAVSIRRCASREALADLLLASSSVPPFTPVRKLGRSTALDGGVADNVPVRALKDSPGRTLLLLTRPYPAHTLERLPGDRLYVQPSQDIRVSKFDYTSPQLLQMAYDMGRADAERFLRRWPDVAPRPG